MVPTNHLGENSVTCTRPLRGALFSYAEKDLYAYEAINERLVVWLAFFVVVLFYIFWSFLKHADKDWRQRMPDLIFIE